MTIVNPSRGEVTISLEGVEYGMRPSYEAIVAIEAGTGKALMELARAAATGALGVAHCATIVTECVRAWGRSTDDRNAARFTADAVAPLLIEEGIMLVLKRLELLLFLAVSGGVTASGEVKAVPTTTETTGA